MKPTPAEFLRPGVSIAKKPIISRPRSRLELYPVGGWKFKLRTSFPQSKRIAKFSNSYRSSTTNIGTVKFLTPIFINGHVNDKYDSFSTVLKHF